MKTFILDSDAGLVGQTTQCCENISDYIIPLGLDATKVAKFVTANTYGVFVLAEHIKIQTFAHSFTEYKSHMLRGPSKDLMGAIPQLPVYPAVLPTISLGNIRALFADIIQDCVRSNNFTRDIGILLGFVKTEAEEKAEEVTPNLTIKLTTGGHPILHATKGIYQGYEVWKDTGDGKGYLMIAMSLYADYTDVTPLPAINVGVTWKYKVIYILKGEHCGNWSAEVTIGVFGLI